MIADIASVSMSDGAHLPAMEVYPGRDGLLSFGQKQRWVNARVVDRKVGSQLDVIGVMLSNGHTLCGSRDQRVAFQGKKFVQFRQLADIAIGDRLKGEVAGMPTTVIVTGLLFSPKKEVRLVGFELDHGKNFVADGVICRC
jgi:hypothetical protein